MLWPGHHIASYDKLPKPILDEIPVLNVPPIPVNGKSAAKVGAEYSTANCSAEVWDIPAGATFFWFFHLDEIMYVLQGEADITFSLASTSHTAQKKMHVVSGDFYLVPLGARLTWNVPAGGQPLRQFSITIPGVPSSSPKRADIARAAGK